MNDREALTTLIEAAFISDTDKARLLASIPALSDEDVQALGKIFADEEIAFDTRLTSALEQIETFLRDIPS